MTEIVLKKGAKVRVRLCGNDDDLTHLKEKLVEAVVETGVTADAANMPGQSHVWVTWEGQRLLAFYPPVEIL